MKLIKLTTSEGLVIGLQHEHGRVERVLTSTETLASCTPEQAELLDQIARRVVSAFNACNGISDKTLHALAEDQGGSSGTIAERVVAWSLFVSQGRPTANRLLEKARQIIGKQAGGLL